MAAIKKMMNYKVQLLQGNMLPMNAWRCLQCMLFCIIWISARYFIEYTVKLVLQEVLLNYLLIPSRMPVLQKMIVHMGPLLLISVLIPSDGSVVVSSGELLEKAEHRTANNVIQKIDPQLKLQMEVHGFMLWASVGLLTPVGVVLIRMSHRAECRRRLKILFYFHAVLEMVSVLLATVGAIMALKNFENKFDNTHQRIGIAIYAFIWLQPLIGLCRPQRGIKGRSAWYFLHWLLGTGVSLLGFINIYIGLYAYHSRTSNNVTTWVILLTAEVSFISFLYLLQDRWGYLQMQSSVLVLGAEEPIRSTHQASSLSNKMGGTHS
ncbi:unnamed protein product [Victoria cruziana]